MIKEAGQKRWAIISIVYSIATAWLLAFLINQIGKLL
jgi:Fe2+ transport system protein B